MPVDLREKLSPTRSLFQRIGDVFRSGRRREEILDDLEPPLTLAAPLAGHLVTGHVDAVGRVLKVSARPAKG